MVNFTPHVNTREIGKDLTVQKASSSNAGLAVAAEWGPCNVIRIVANEGELLSQFWKPVIGTNEMSWMVCAEFLKNYGNTMHIVRPIDDDAANSNNASLLVDAQTSVLSGAWATANGASKPLKINEDDADPAVTFVQTRRLTVADVSGFAVGETVEGETSGSTGVVYYIDSDNDQLYLTSASAAFTPTENIDNASPFVAAVTTVTTDDGTGFDQIALLFAKYPGTAGNQIKVAMSDSASFSSALVYGSTTFAELFDTKPYKILTVADPNVFVVGDGIAGATSGSGTVVRIDEDRIYVDVTSGTFTTEGVDNASTFVAAETTITAVNDELAMVVMFENEIKEKMIVSTHVDSKNLNGDRDFIETYLENSSNYLNAVVDETGDVTIANFSGSFVATALTNGKSTIDLTAVQNAYDILFNEEEYDVRLIGDMHDLSISDLKTLQGSNRGLADANAKKVSVINLPKSVINVASFNITTVTDHIAASIGSSYVAVYDNWKKVYDKYNKKRYFIPCTGDALGVIVRTIDNFAVWSAPFGNEKGQIANVEALYHKTTPAIRDLLYKNGVNSIFKKRAKGNVVWGQKTLANAASSRSRLNVRLNLIDIKVNMENILDDFISEESNVETWRSITNTCDDGYLKELNGAGAFDNSNGIGYKFVCDGTNNTPDKIDAYTMVCDLIVKPIKSAEIIEFNITIVSSGVNIEEL